MLQRVEVEWDHFHFAERRAGPIVKHDLACGGTLDSAAASAYLQGVRDTLESLDRSGFPPTTETTAEPVRG